MVKVNIEITLSKMMSLIVLALSFIMDYANDKGGTVFMFSLPFVVFLITGKQYLDYKKGAKNES